MSLFKIILAAASFSIIFTGCSTTTNRSHGSAPLEMQLSSKMTADIDVDMSKKITGNATYKKFLFFTTVQPENFADGVTYSLSGSGNSAGLLAFLSGGGTVDAVKSAAAFNALNSSKAEILVAPSYIVKSTKDLFSQEITVQVSGYAGRLKTIKPGGTTIQ